MTEVEGEIARVGTFNASTGECTFRDEDLSAMQNN